MLIPIILVLLFAFYPVTSAQSQTRCQCSYQYWEGDCQARVEFNGNWFKVVSNTQQCSRVDWFIDEQPNVTIVTDGADMEEWLGQGQPSSITIQSCKVCRDTQFSVSKAPKKCTYRITNFIDEVGLYEGQCKNGIAHGQGRISFPSGGHMEGEFVDGRANGYGVHTYASGSRYEGNYRDNERRGYGIYYFHDGGRHEGEFDVYPNGDGIYYGPNGGREVGYFKDNKLIKGMLYLPTGKICNVSSGHRERGC